MVLANNATYCPGATAVDAAGLTGSSITVRSNYVEGGLSGASVDNVGFFSGGSASSTFVNPQQFDFWPRLTSALVGNAYGSLVPTLDFNERIRTSPYDVGAYETDGLPANPGWTIVPGFKQASGQSSIPPAAPANLRVQ